MSFRVTIEVVDRNGVLTAQTITIDHRQTRTSRSTVDVREIPKRKRKSREATKEDTKENCSVCLSQKEGTLIELECRHSFHESCVAHWMDTRGTCPVCRHKESNVQDVLGILQEGDREQGVDDGTRRPRAGSG